MSRYDPFSFSSCPAEYFLSDPTHKEQPDNVEAINRASGKVLDDNVFERIEDAIREYLGEKEALDAGQEPIKTADVLDYMHGAEKVLELFIELLNGNFDDPAVKAARARLRVDQIESKTGIKLQNLTELQKHVTEKTRAYQSNTELYGTDKGGRNRDMPDSRLLLKLLPICREYSISGERRINFVEAVYNAIPEQCRPAPLKAAKDRDSLKKKLERYDDQLLPPKKKKT